MSKRAVNIVLYRETIPVEVREALKQKLLEAKMQGYDEFIDVASFIMANTLSLDIPVDVAKECRGYMELIFTAIAARNLEAKNKEASPGTLAAKLRKDRRAGQKLRPQIQLTQTLDGDVLGDISLVQGREKVPLEAPWEKNLDDEDPTS